MIWLLSILSALCFWIGGRDWGHKVSRRFFCPAIALAAIYFLEGFEFSHWWVYLLFYATNAGALSTYCDFLGVDKGDFQEETTLSWAISGALYGLAALPLIWCGTVWWLIVIRIIALTMAIPLIRKIPAVHAQEALSGFIYLTSLKILFW